MALYPRATEKISLVNDEEELRKRGYLLGSTLGEGSYAKVKSAFAEAFNRKVALKIINRKKAPKDFQQKFLPRELEILRMVQHPNVVRLYDIMQFNGKVFIVMEMAGHGDLLEYIKLRGAVSEEKARHMFQQLVNGLEYLHSVQIIHRDLKCENILLDAQNNIKISDFGFARILRQDDVSKTFCGSAAYAAPEILQGIPYSTHAYDIWSLGVILYIMVCGSMPYDDSNIKKMIKYQTERKVGFSRSKRLSPEVRELIHAMLEAEIRLRFTISQVQDSTWLKKIRLVAPPVMSVTSCVIPSPAMEGNTNTKGREMDPQLHKTSPIDKDQAADVPRPQTTATERQKPPGPPAVEHINHEMEQMELDT